MSRMTREQRLKAGWVETWALRSSLGWLVSPGKGITFDRKGSYRETSAARLIRAWNVCSVSIDDCWPVLIWRKPKAPPPREVLEGIAEVSDPTMARRWPTRVVFDQGGGQCASIYDSFLKNNEGKRVRVTFEVVKP